MNEGPVFEVLKKALDGAEASERSAKNIGLPEAVRRITDLIFERNRKGNKVVLVGNGGSASIASHIATDLLKNGNVRAICFNDSSLLTCISNDLGYENVFRKPLGVLGEKDDVLIAISSSGKSPNILNAVEAGRACGCFIVTLSGFLPDNPLRRAGDINFYVPSDSYGVVEIVHMAIAHAVADILTDSARNG